MGIIDNHTEQLVKHSTVPLKYKYQKPKFGIIGNSIAKNGISTTIGSEFFIVLIPFESVYRN